MTVSLRTALAPLVLVLLLAVQGSAAPDASAGRTAKIARPTKSKASLAKRSGAQRTRAASRSRLRTRPTSRLIRPSRTGLSGKTLGSKNAQPRAAKLQTRPAASKPAASKSASSKSASKLRSRQRSPSLRTKATRTKATRTKATRTKATRKQVAGASKPAAKVSRWSATKKATQAALAKFKAHPRVVRIVKAYTKVTASLTRKLDGMQARAPPIVAKAMNILRTYTLPSIAAYTFSRVKNDRTFLGTYLASSSIVSNVILPGAIALGLDPVLSGVLNALTTPITLGVIVLRERHNRREAGEEISVAATTRLITREYRDFAKARRVASSAAAAQVPQ